MFENENGVAEAEAEAEAEQEAEQESATPQEALEDEEPSPEGEKTGETAEIAEPHIPNKVWEVARKRAEAEASVKFERELSEEKAEKERIFSALEGLGYKGSPQEIADQIEALSRKVEPEQVKEEREQEEAKLCELERRHKAELAAIEDLHSIQRINPAVKSLDELGDEFFEKRFTINGRGELVYTAASAYLELQKSKIPKQRADNSGKEHLIPTGGTAVKGLLSEIPASEQELYRDMFPNDTPAQLKERYNRVLKRQGE